MNQISEAELKRLFPNASRSTLKANYGKAIVSPVVRPLQTVQQKQDDLSPLVPGKPRREKRKGRVRCLVTLIACRKRECDDDGNVAGLFHWRDAIAKALGVDDSDRRVKWAYGQIETSGETGIIVKIEAL